MNAWLWIKALHVIAMVAWFAGLFYLPRLFVYHAGGADDTLFKTMERRLYYGITWPAALVTTFAGIWMLMMMPAYLKAGWMHAKLGMVVLLWGYHLLCGHYRRRFADNKNRHGAGFYRVFNEVPTLLLVGMVVMVIVRP